MRHNKRLLTVEACGDRVSRPPRAPAASAGSTDRPWSPQEAGLWAPMYQHCPPPSGCGLVSSGRTQLQGPSVSRSRGVATEGQCGCPGAGGLCPSLGSPREGSSPQTEEQPELTDCHILCLGVSVVSPFPGAPSHTPHPGFLPQA